MKTVAHGHFDRRTGGALNNMTYEISIESPANEDMIRLVAREAEAMCYAYNTLKKAVRM